MCSPEPNDPQDAEVANMYLSNYEQFCSTARFWTESYASDGTTIKEVHPSVKRLMDMGFTEESVRQALLDCKGDENAAVEVLLSSM